VTPTTVEISLIERPTLHISHTCCRLSDGSPGRPIFAMHHLHDEINDINDGVALTR
jgi:hypothetical protein